MHDWLTRSVGPCVVAPRISCSNGRGCACTGTCAITEEQQNSLHRPTEPMMINHHKHKKNSLSVSLCSLLSITSFHFILTPLTQWHTDTTYTASTTDSTNTAVGYASLQLPPSWTIKSQTQNFSLIRLSALFALSLLTLGTPPLTHWHSSSIDTAVGWASQQQLNNNLQYVLAHNHIFQSSSLLLPFVLFRPLNSSYRSVFWLSVIR